LAASTSGSPTMRSSGPRVIFQVTGKYPDEEVIPARAEPACGHGRGTIFPWCAAAPACRNGLCT